MKPDMPRTERQPRSHVYGGRTSVEKAGSGGRRGPAKVLEIQAQREKNQNVGDQQPSQTRCSLPWPDVTFVTAFVAIAKR